MRSSQSIRIAQTHVTDARAAAREFHAAVAQPDIALVVFFCSTAYALDELADEMRRLFVGTRVIGCTTAGEIGPSGYLQHGMSGASFARDEFQVATGRLDHLRDFDIGTGAAFVEGLTRQLHDAAPDANADNTFAFLLIDGLSMREEIVARTFQTALGEFQLVGGSAGDGLRFNNTYVYDDGAFHENSAVLILISTPLPFKLFKAQHFVATDQRLVVTEADTAQRIVKEINGLPAAAEYARILGLDVAGLTPMHFATSPMVVLIDGANYVRSIQKLNPDGSLSFYCAIEEGLVLRVAKGSDLIESLQQTFERLRTELGPLQLVFSCDCILRMLEAQQSGVTEKVAQIFQDNKTVGFATYGEQFGGVHINQTLTGIAIGSAMEKDHA